MAQALRDGPTHQLIVVAEAATPGWVAECACGWQARYLDLTRATRAFDHHAADDPGHHIPV